MVAEEIEVWDIPYPGCDRTIIRDKKFKKVRDYQGRILFCKQENIKHYLEHEAEILTVLKGIDGVPEIVGFDQNGLYTVFVEGKLLPEVIDKLNFAQVIGIGLKTIDLVRKIHKRNVVHSDIIPWNFLLGQKNKLFLLDYEYSYLRRQNTEFPEFLHKHHGAVPCSFLKDWVDVISSLVSLWKSSSYIFTRGLGACMVLISIILWQLLLIEKRFRRKFR